MIPIPINPDSIGDPNQTPVVYIGDAGEALGIPERRENVSDETPDTTRDVLARLLHDRDCSPECRDSPTTWGTYYATADAVLALLSNHSSPKEITMTEINKIESTEPTLLTREQLIRQLALDKAMQQISATGDNKHRVSELLSAAERIADWVRGAPAAGSDV